VLRVVPHRGDGVAVVITHHLAGAVFVGRRTRQSFTRAGEFWEKIHLAVVERLLFGRVIVILVGGRRLRAVEAERIDRTRAITRIGGGRIVRQKRGSQAVDAWCERRRIERWLARRVGGIRIGAEVMIERNVFLENHHQMLDWCGSAGVIAVAEIG
jgi:hypothetical protein